MQDQPWRRKEMGPPQFLLSAALCGRSPNGAGIWQSHHHVSAMTCMYSPAGIWNKFWKLQAVAHLSDLIELLGRFSIKNKRRRGNVISPVTHAINYSRISVVPGCLPAEHLHVCDSSSSFFGHFSHRSEWQLIKIDYKGLFSRRCMDGDYQTWHLYNKVPGILNTIDLLSTPERCMLGYLHT